MEHSFNIEFATKHGLDEAILHHYYILFRYLNKSDPTIPELLEHFTYWDISHISFLINKLLDQKLI